MYFIFGLYQCQKLLGALILGKKGRISRLSFSTLLCSVINSKFTADTSELSPKIQGSKNTNHTPWREGGSSATLHAVYENFSSKQNTLTQSSAWEPLTSPHNLALCIATFLNRFAFRLGTAVDFCLYLGWGTDSIWGRDKSAPGEPCCNRFQTSPCRCASVALGDSG